MQVQIRNMCIAVFIANIVFWLWIAINYAYISYSGDEAFLIMKILLFLEPVCFLAALIGYLKKVRFIYGLTMFFLLVNATLSLTDEIGVLDIVSFSLSLMLLVLLAVQRKRYKRKD